MKKKKGQTSFLDEWAIHLKEKKKIEVQLVQNTTKQYSTNIETAYTTP